MGMRNEIVVCTGRFVCKLACPENPDFASLEPQVVLILCNVGYHYKYVTQMKPPILNVL